MSIRRLVGSGYPTPGARDEATAAPRPILDPGGSRASAALAALAASLGAVVVCLVWRAVYRLAGYLTL